VGRFRAWSLAPKCSGKRRPDPRPVDADIGNEGRLAQVPTVRSENGARAGLGCLRYRPQNTPENIVAHLKCLRTVILIISRSHHEDEIEFRNDADCL
jgi:hypothetical protein